MTPDAHDYEFFWLRPNRLTFEFKVKACSDAHVGLLSGFDFATSTIPYEIVIGELLVCVQPCGFRCTATFSDVTAYEVNLLLSD